MTPVRDAGGYANPVIVHAGEGALAALDELLRDRRVLLVTSAGAAKRGWTTTVEQAAGDLAAVIDDVPSHPSVADAERAGAVAQRAAPDVVCAFGGGSVMDVAKAVIAQVSAEAAPGWLGTELRAGRPLSDLVAAADLVAVPTTAGTGSEVTRWGTLWDEVTRAKYSVDHDALYPTHAIVDPSLTTTLPRDETVHGAFDALSHAMEAVWNKRHNAVSDALAEAAMRAGRTGLPFVLANPRDATGRALLQQASLTAGLAFSNTRTAIAHSLSYPLTGRFGVPHGIACSFTLPDLLLHIAQAGGRVRPILAGLGVSTAAEGAERIAAAMQAAGVATALAPVQAWRASGDWSDLTLLNKARADNTVVPFSADDAAHVLDAALARFGTTGEPTAARPESV